MHGLPLEELEELEELALLDASPDELALLDASPDELALLDELDASPDELVAPVPPAPAPPSCGSRLIESPPQLVTATRPTNAALISLSTFPSFELCTCNHARLLPPLSPTGHFRGVLPTILLSRCI